MPTTKVFTGAPNITQRSPSMPEIFCARDFNIALCSFHPEKQQDLANITVPNKISYCSEHGYGIEFSHQPSERGTQTNGAALWDAVQKLAAVRDIIERYDAVLWMDCDALVMNPSFRIEALIDEFGGKRALTIAHTGKECINAGVFLVENCPESIQFLDWALREDVHAAALEDHQGEQRLLNNFVSAYPELCRVLPQRMMNSALTDEYPVYLYPWGKYAKGDWIVHLAGIPFPRRTELARTLLNE